MIYFLIVAFIFLIILIVITNVSTLESRRKKAGKQGEQMIFNQIRQIINDKDQLLTNVEIIYDQKRTELDDVIINENGVFIIEVKNLRGQLYGHENDNIWQRYKKSGGGNIYYDTVKNPIGQVKRHIYLLSHYLKSYGINVWIEGYVIFVNDNSPCKSEYILNDIDELELILHDKMRKQLNKKQVYQIVDLIENRQM